MITTHVLDTALGQPAAGITVQLSLLDTDNWVDVTQGTTNQDGRIPGWLDGKTLLAGTYRIRFELEDYLHGTQQPVFYPYAEIVFVVADPAAHFHIPLLLSPFGYSTYRGS